jgi:primosomal replication protein N
MTYAVNESGIEALGCCPLCLEAWAEYRDHDQQQGDIRMYNTCTLVGCVGDEGTATVAKRTGTRMCGFRLHLTNTRQDGQRYTTRIDIECYGQTIAQAEGLEPGAVALVEGKIAPRRGTTGEASLVIMARQVQELPAAATALIDARDVEDLP